jgi:phosphinothricin acetyltransferase
MGHASFGDWRAWECYRDTVEHSLYVNAEHRRKGIGKALMLALIKQARSLGKHVMVADIETGNNTSIRLHKKLGFECVGHLKQVGKKFGIWLDQRRTLLQDWADYLSLGREAAQHRDDLGRVLQSE